MIAITLQFADPLLKNQPAAKIANRFADPRYSKVLRREIEGLCLEFIDRAGEKSIDDYTRRRLSDTYGKGYSLGMSKWVRASAALTCELIRAPSAYAAYPIGAGLRAVGNWPDSVIELLVFYAAHCHRSEPNYRNPEFALPYLCTLPDILARTAGIAGDAGEGFFPATTDRACET